MPLSVETLATILQALDHCLNAAEPMPSQESVRRAWVDVRALEILTREDHEPRQ